MRPPRRWRRLWLAVLGLAWALCHLLAGLAGAASTAPPLQIPPLIIQAATPALEAHLRQIVGETAPRLAAWTGASPQRLNIVVAASEEDFKDRVAQLDGPRWAAGLAVPSQGLILLRSPRQLIEPEQFRLLLAHELTHLYLAAALRHRQHPLWLEEGLAMYASGEGGWERAAVMAKGVLGGHLLSFADLEESFPQDANQAALAYAQSYYFISYLLNRQGPEVLPKIIGGLARGKALTAALHEASGQGLYALERDFRDEMNTRFSWLTLATAGGGVWVLISMVAAVSLVVRRRAHKARMAAMPDGGMGGVQVMRRHWPPPARPNWTRPPQAGSGPAPPREGEGNSRPEGD